MSRKIRYPFFALIASIVLTLLMRSATIKRPHVVLVQPENGAQHVSERPVISATVVNLTKGGIKATTLTNTNVFLSEKGTGIRVPASVKNVDGSNVITLTPTTPLKLGTSYVLNVSDDVEDRSGNSFVTYTSTFTTASVPTKELLNVKFEKLPLPNTAGQYTSLTIGPDGKLYALALDGLIKRFPINTDGTLGKPDSLYALQDAHGKRQQRLSIGLTFDPASTPNNLVAYVTNCSFMLNDAPDWDGRLTRLSGTNLQNAQDLVINLPRSAKDHLTNSIAFGPDGALYFTQGSTTAMGEGDKTWSYRQEHLLSAAVLRLDLNKLGALPLDVRTKEGGGNYNPYATNAPLTIYATGLRNAYDLVWHSNGELYVPTNGSASGGNTPASVAGALRPNGQVYNGPVVPALKNVQQVERDFLFRVTRGGYYGHPNPLRGEYVMNGGNPTSATDPAQVDAYPVGTKPDANWQGYAFDFMANKSPDGAIEYKSNAFNGALKGKLLVARYSTINDIIVLTPGGPQKNIVSYSDGASIEGLSGFVMPLDLTEDVRTGNIYVSEFGTERISLLKPKLAPVREATAIVPAGSQPSGK